MQYDIIAIVGMQEDDELGRLHKVKWADGTETEEPMSSLLNVPEMVAEFENRGKGARKATMARNAGRKERYAEGSEETGGKGRQSMIVPGGAPAELTETEKCW